MYLFLDTNIWLSLYSMSSDDIEQFEKLQKHKDIGVQLIITEQVVDEVHRNRDGKVKEALDKFKELSIVFPNIVKEMDEYEQFKEEYAHLVTEQKKLQKKVNEAVNNRQTRADKAISYFFKHDIVKVSGEIVDKAVLRYKKGNPPGKNDSYGDAINWECLLEFVPEGEDLYLVTADKDYCSALDNKLLNHFLEREWKKQKRSNVFFYSSLTAFFRDNIEEIKLITENKKNELIEELYLSGNFNMTHDIISDLSMFPEWDSNQIERLCEAAMENGQVKLILHDNDVYRFYRKLLRDNSCDNQELVEIVLDLLDGKS